MVQDFRSPGDTQLKTWKRSFDWEYWIPNSQGRQTTSQVYKESRRPLYHKGKVVTLQKGTKFRKATEYSHATKELLPSPPYEMRGYAWRDQVGTPEWFRRSVDSREVWTFLENLEWAHDGTGLLEPYCPTSMRNESVTKALNQLADQKVNLSENLATLGQTLRLFTEKGFALYSALASMKSNKSLKPFLYKSYRDIMREGISRTIAQEYLKYVYGFAPLMSDLYGLAELAKRQSSTDLLLKARGFSNRDYYLGETREFARSYSRAKRLSGIETCVAKTTLWAQIDPNFSGNRALNQLGLVNPASLVWELVPWSFVVDWFVPVGPVLSALTAPAGLIFVDGTLSFKAETTLIFDYKTQAAGMNNSYSKTILETPCHPTLQASGFRRTVFGNWPLPGLWVCPDPFRFDRPAKALALCIAQLKK